MNLNSLIPPGLGEEIQATLTSVSGGLVHLLISAMLLLVGWLLATGLGRLTQAVISLVGVDKPFMRLSRPGAAGSELKPSRFAGHVVFWTTLLAACVVALRAIGLDLVPSITSRLQDVVPRVLTSALVLLFGIPISLGVGRLLGALLKSIGIRMGRRRSQAVTALLILFTALLALEQLGLAAQLVLAVGIAGIGAVGLGLALAFGLGCRDLARDLVVEYLRATEPEEPSSRT